MSRPSAPTTRYLQLAASALVPLLLVACAATSGAAAPTDRPATEPTPRPTPALPSAAADATTAPGGPADYALWVERQGFGGSSGLRQVLKGATWIRDHAFEATVFDVDNEMGFADRLAGWLDKNPPAPCWADYHAAVRATLDRLLDAYGAAHDARVAGHSVPIEVGATLVAEAQSAFDLPAPAGC